MPTPFYHLSVAEELTGSKRLSARIHSLLAAERSAFLFGNTAPDVQVVSLQARQDTHFYDLPLRPKARSAWEQFLTVHPSLKQVNDLPSNLADHSNPANHDLAAGQTGRRLDRDLAAPDQTGARSLACLTTGKAGDRQAQVAFLAGYLCHLQADWLWSKDIFAPVFGLRSPWGTFPQRLYLHNVLRAYLDRQILPSLTNGTCTSLAHAAPAGWLPFVRDEHLRQWRDFLVSQLRPASPIQTVEVFAARQGVSPDTFYRLLDSEDAMEREIFVRIPRHTLDHYRKQLVEENINLLEMYLRSI